MEESVLEVCDRGDFGVSQGGLWSSVNISTARGLEVRVLGSSWVTVSVGI